jgi:hypothetical protein
MTLPPVFPDVSDHTYEAHLAIAKRLGCDEFQVGAAFKRAAPQWITPAHFDALKQRTLALNEAARLADRLHKTMRRLPSDAIDNLISEGAITIPQIEYLGSLLSGESKNYDEWRNMRYSGGRTNPAANDIAEGMRRLFRRLRKPITFGQSDSGDGPSTEFGRAVEFALGAFGVNAHWRRAAEKAYRKQQKIEGRRCRCALWKFERDRDNTTRHDK